MRLLAFVLLLVVLGWLSYSVASAAVLAQEQVEMQRAGMTVHPPPTPTP